MALAAGGMLVLSLPKLDWYPLAWVALVPLLFAIATSKTTTRAATAAYVVGVVFFGGTCYWITETMTVYGGLHPAAAFGVGLLFALVYALFFAAFGLALVYFVRKFGMPGVLLAGPLWVTIELIRSRFFFEGFPWMLSGYALVPYGGILQIVSWTGIYGLSFIAVAVNSMFA